MNLLEACANEYKTMHWCFTRPFSPPQVVKVCARETRFQMATELLFVRSIRYGVTQNFFSNQLKILYMYVPLKV